MMAAYLLIIIDFRLTFLANRTSSHCVVSCINFDVAAISCASGRSHKSNVGCYLYEDHSRVMESFSNWSDKNWLFFCCPPTVGFNLRHFSVSCDGVLSHWWLVFGRTKIPGFLQRKICLDRSSRMLCRFWWMFVCSTLS